MILDLLLIFILILLSGFFSGSETAFFSLRESEVAQMKEKKEKHGGLIFDLRQDPERLLSTILIGNNIVNIVAASYATVVATEMYGSYAVGIATGILTVAVLVFGEILPKSLALTYNTQFARIAARPLFVVHTIFYPVSSITEKLSKFLQRALRTKKTDGVTEEEVRYMVKMGLKSGFIEKGEHELIEKVFLFNDITLEEILVPIDKVEMFRSDMAMSAITKEVIKHGYARYPVIDSNSTIIGYVTDHDILRAESEEKTNVPVSQFVTPIKSLPATTAIDDAFRSMKKSGIHMHLVHDPDHPETVLGIVTLEDIIEELLGEIEDEEDKKSASPKRIRRKM